jgi:hypothetical protein
MYYIQDTMNRMKLPQYIKDHRQKAHSLTYSIMKNKAFPLRSGMRQEWLISLLLLNTLWQSFPKQLGKKRNERHPN